MNLSFSFSHLFIFVFPQDSRARVNPTNNRSDPKKEREHGGEAKPATAAPVGKGVRVAVSPRSYRGFSLGARNHAFASTTHNASLARNHDLSRINSAILVSLLVLFFHESRATDRRGRCSFLITFLARIINRARDREDPVNIDQLLVLHEHILYSLFFDSSMVN